LVDNLVIDLHPEDIDLVRDMDEHVQTMCEMRGELHQLLMKAQQIFQSTLTCFPSVREKKAALEPLKQLKELMTRQLNYEQSLNMEVIEESEPLPDLAPEPALVPEPSDPDDAEPSDPDDMLTSDQ
ncbi:unnamed protein product, partial [Meganyctiphanes norvegica]